MEQGAEGNYLKNIKKGMKVEILARVTKKKVVGIVEDIGKNTDSQIVRLKSGEIGRIQQIISEKPVSEIEFLLKRGENYKLEFKSEALWSANYKEQDIQQSKSSDLRSYHQKTSKVIIAKSIAALLNSEGGNLIIGVKEKKQEASYEIAGIHPDIEKLKSQGKDFSKDGYKRMIIDDIIRQYFPSRVYNQLNDYITMKFEELDNKLLFNLQVKPSRTRVFLNLAGRKVFMIRTETETRQIEDEELVDYCMRRFLS